MKLKVIADSSVVAINKRVCMNGGNPHAVLRPHGVGSAITTAFWPGDPVYVHGGIGGVAGALCFYLTQAHAFQDGNKRTAMDAALLVMLVNGWSLSYPSTPTTSALAELVESVAKKELGIAGVKDWFDLHKTPLP